MPKRLQHMRKGRSAAARSRSCARRFGPMEIYVKGQTARALLTSLSDMCAANMGPSPSGLLATVQHLNQSGTSGFTRIAGDPSSMRGSYPAQAR
jgi:hypothetical protein